MVLTGLSQHPDRPPWEVNFRVYINPLINWVWLGFFFLALGTMICMVPQRWVDRMTPGKKARIGRLGAAAERTVPRARAKRAVAQAPDPRSQLEHKDPLETGGLTHQQAAAHLSRPDDAAF